MLSTYLNVHLCSHIYGGMWFDFLKLVSQNKTGGQKTIESVEG